MLQVAGIMSTILVWCVSMLTGAKWYRYLVVLGKIKKTQEHYISHNATTSHFSLDFSCLANAKMFQIPVSLMMTSLSSSSLSSSPGPLSQTWQSPISASTTDAGTRLFSTDDATFLCQEQPLAYTVWKLSEVCGDCCGLWQVAKESKTKSGRARNWVFSVALKMLFFSSQFHICSIKNHVSIFTCLMMLWDLFN